MELFNIEVASARRAQPSQSHFYIGAWLLFFALSTLSLPAQQNYSDDVRGLLDEYINNSEIDKPRDRSTSNIDPLFWFKVDSLSEHADGEQLAEWKDQSVNRHHAISHGNNSMPTYRFDPDLEENARPYLEFNGKSNRFNIRDHRDINYRYYYKEKTVIAVFRTGYDIESQQIIYEEGGYDRGLNISLDKGRMYIGGYNLRQDDRDTTPWGYAYLSIPIELNQFYIAVLIYNYNKKAFEGYLNGKYLGIIRNIGLLYTHPGGTGIGAINYDAVLHNNIYYADGVLFFNGGLYEILYYDSALNLSQTAVVQAYLTAKYDIDSYGL